jgi:hypothetical protein
MSCGCYAWRFASHAYVIIFSDKAVKYNVIALSYYVRVAKDNNIILRAQMPA